MQKFLLVCVAGLLTACGAEGEPDSRASETPKPSPTPVATTAPSLDDRVYFPRIQLSTKKFLTTPRGLQVRVNLSTIQTEAQIPHYDEQKQEGLLGFNLHFDYPKDGVEREPFGGLKLFNCERESYLFTKADQRRIGVSYDNGGTKIFLKHAGKEYEIGAYQEAEFNEDSQEQLERFTHPILCEGPYASLCRVEMVTQDLQGKEANWPYFKPEVHLNLLLSGGVKVQAITAKPVFGYRAPDAVGCE
jgi:hypothetical protein